MVPRPPLLSEVDAPAEGPALGPMLFPSEMKNQMNSSAKLYCIKIHTTDVNIFISDMHLYWHILQVYLNILSDKGFQYHEYHAACFQNYSQVFLIHFEKKMIKWYLSKFYLYTETVPWCRYHKSFY